MPNRIKPPAIRNASNVIPNSLKITPPKSAKVMKIPVAIKLERLAVVRMVVFEARGSSDTKMKAVVSGFTMTNRAAMVINKYSISPVNPIGQYPSCQAYGLRHSVICCRIAALALLASGKACYTSFSHSVSLRRHGVPFDGAPLPCSNVCATFSVSIGDWARTRPKPS